MVHVHVHVHVFVWVVHLLQEESSPLSFLLGHLLHLYCLCELTDRSEGDSDLWLQVRGKHRLQREDGERRWLKSIRERCFSPSPLFSYNGDVIQSRWKLCFILQQLIDPLWHNLTLSDQLTGIEHGLWSKHNHIHNHNMCTVHVHCVHTCTGCICTFTCTYTCQEYLTKLQISSLQRASCPHVHVHAHVHVHVHGRCKTDTKWCTGMKRCVGITFVHVQAQCTVHGIPHV